MIELEKRFSPLGDVDVSDEGRSGHQRRVRFRVAAPGYGLPTEAILEYAEWYDRTARGWVLREYTFEYRPQRPPSRLAHHLHEPFGPHRHCVDRRRPRDADHYEGYPVVLEQAHDEFATLAARHRPIGCAGLRPLKERPRARS